MRISKFVWSLLETGSEQRSDLIKLVSMV